MDADTQVLVALVIVLPLLLAATFLLLLGGGSREQRDDRRWRGVHRRGRGAPVHGRHELARGQRLKGVSRQAQLEEPTGWILRRPDR